MRYLNFYRLDNRRNILGHPVQISKEKTCISFFLISEPHYWVKAKELNYCGAILLFFFIMNQIPPSYKFDFLRSRADLSNISFPLNCRCWECQHGDFMFMCWTAQVFSTFIPLMFQYQL